MADKSLKVLVGFVRNRLHEGKPFTFVLSKQRIFVTPLSAFGDTVPGLLIAAERRASVVVGPGANMDYTTFVLGNFSLTQAQTLSKVFKALKATHQTHSVEGNAHATKIE